MGRSDSDLRTISPIWRFQKNMLSMRIILCSVLLAVVISAADKEETKSLSETESLDRVIRAGGEGNRRRKKSNDRRRKRKTKAARKRSRKSGVGKRRLNRRRGDRKRSKGRKESRRKNKNFRTSASLRDSRSSGLNETCLIQAVFFMKLWKDTVANYQKQKSRMTKQNSTGSGKSGKKGLFAPIAHRLVDIGGGNKTKAKMSSLAGSSSGRRRMRATAASCAEVISKSEIVISYANSFPSSSKIYTISKEISSASVTCTEAEKSSLTTQVTSMESAITQVSNALVAVQEQIKTISGSTASSAQLTTSMTTSAPSRRRGKEWIKS